MSDARGARDERLVVDNVVRKGVSAAAREGIVVGARVGGEVRELAAAGTIDAVRRIMRVRDDPEQLKRPAPYGKLSKRASELPNFPQLSPFVHRVLIAAGRLAVPTVIEVRTVAVDMPPARTVGAVGRKRAGVAAIALHADPPVRGAGWAAIHPEHVIQPGQSDYDRAQIEKPLSQLLDALKAAHPGIPIVINNLTWPHLTDGIFSYGSRYPDIALQLKWHEGGQLVFRCPAPPNALHFKPVITSGPLGFRSRDIGTRRTIEMIDPYGKRFYYKTATSVTCETAAGAISKVEEERTALESYSQQFRSCGVLIGNAQTDAAIAVRAACVQIADLLADAAVADFATEPINRKRTPS